GPLSGPGVELDGSTQRACELVRDRQAESCARIVARPEGAEDPLLLLDRDARTTVVDRDGHAAVRRGQLELHPAAIRSPAKRVREKVGDDLQDAVAVGDDRRLRLEPLRVLDPAPAGLLTEGAVG